MEFRRLIAFGKSSFVISLPRNWVDRHNLAKGSVLGISSNDDKLLVSPKVEDDSDESREIRINVDGKESNRITREIISAYIANYNLFVFSGKDLAKSTTSIRNTLKNLMAVEVMEQTSNKLVARDFMNLKTLDMNSIIRKADMIIRSMLADVKKKTITKHNVETLEHRDGDVDRLTFLMQKAIRYGLQNPFGLSSKLTSLDLLEIYRQITQMEIVADETIRLVRIAPKLKGKEYEELLDTLNNIERAYKETMKAVHSKNILLAHQLAVQKHDIYQRCNERMNDKNITPEMARCLHQLKVIARAIHNIGRTVYI